MQREDHAAFSRWFRALQIITSIAGNLGDYDHSCTHYLHELMQNCKYQRDQGPVSRKSRRLYGPEKPFVKLRPAHSAKLISSYVVKWINIKIIAKFHVTEHLRFEDTRRIMSPETFRDFRETGPSPQIILLPPLQPSFGMSRKTAAKETTSARPLLGIFNNMTDETLKNLLTDIVQDSSGGGTPVWSDI